MAKRRKFSRWRRLPGVYRFGDEKAPDPNLEPQRLSLYIAGVTLDHAADQAGRLGFENVQDYCTELLVKAIDAERFREHLSELEAKRGALEGLHEIADDPEYLADLNAAAFPRPPAADRPDVMNSLSLSVRLDGVPGIAPARESEPAAASVPETTPSRPRGLALSPAALVVLRHAGQPEDDPGPSYRACGGARWSLRRRSPSWRRRCTTWRSSSATPPRWIAASRSLCIDWRSSRRSSTPTPGRGRSTSGPSTCSARSRRPSNASSRDRTSGTTPTPTRPGATPLTISWPDSPIGGRLGDGRSACATDRPETVDALRQTVNVRVSQGHALYPQGGGTALDYGGIPRAPGVVLDTRSLGRVIDYPAADMTITVEAGITLAALQAFLNEQNQRFQVDAPDPDRATVGAVIATNTSGPRRFGAGRPRDQVIGVSFVTADGALVKGGGRVVKNVAGYDFPRLLTGSLGTLGVIVQLTLKVRPRPEASAIVWVPFAGVEALASALDRLNTSGTRPVALEVLNPPAAHVIGATIGLPTDDWALVIGFEDNAPSVSWQVDRLMVELGRTNVVIREGVDTAPLWTALTGFQAAEVGPVSIVANLRPSTVPGFVNDLDSRRWAVQAHAGNGIVRGHLLGTHDLEAVGREIDQLRAEAVNDGGNLILSRCPPDWKDRLRVWGEPRADWAIADRIKKAFDPRRVMNPGRFVGTI